MLTRKEALADWFGRTPDNVDELIEIVTEARTLGNHTHDLLNDAGASDGFAVHLRKVERERRQLSCYRPASYEDRRIDSILRTRDSDGRATARRWTR